MRATQSASLPPPRTWAQRNPDADKRFTHAREAISELAQVIHMPVENLLTPEILRQVCWAPEGENANDIAQQLARLGARPWQSEACAEVIADAFVHARQNEGEEPPPIS